MIAKYGTGSTVFKSNEQIIRETAFIHKVPDPKAGNPA